MRGGLLPPRDRERHPRAPRQLAQTPRSTSIAEDATPAQLPSQSVGRLGHHRARRSLIHDQPEAPILWHCAGLASSEYASLNDRDNGHRLQGLTVMPLEDRPCHIEYAVVTPRAMRVRWRLTIIRTAQSPLSETIRGSTRFPDRLAGSILPGSPNRGDFSRAWDHVHEPCRTSKLKPDQRI